MFKCAHKTSKDFSTETTNGTLWKCSECKYIGKWQEGFFYYGSLECKHCGMAVIKKVYCNNHKTPQNSIFID